MAMNSAKPVLHWCLARQVGFFGKQTPALNSRTCDAEQALTTRASEARGRDMNKRAPLNPKAFRKGWLRDRNWVKKYPPTDRAPSRT
jgi:hypothetical protein